MTTHIPSLRFGSSRELWTAVRPHLPYALIAAGVALLAYVGTQYFLMAHDQRQLAQQWASQNSAAHSGTATPAKAASIADGLTRILIPKINLDAIVVEGTTAKDLRSGPGHIRSSAYPGEQGNVVISAHRDTFFRHIYELSKGDQVQLQRGGATYTYEVTAKKVTDPNDVAVLKATPDARLTLITCYPTYYIGPAPERLVVFARLLPPANTNEASAAPVVISQPKPE